jgi:predicted nucleic acid-binding protein
MTYAVDTSVLARIIHKNHPMQQTAKDAIKLLLSRDEPLCVFPQNLYEFWVIATRPALQNGFGLAPTDTEAQIVEFEALFSLKRDTPALYNEWRRLVVQHSVLGKTAHDTRIVAAMKTHGVTNLLTFNTDDFKRYTGISVVSPAQVS